MSRYTALLEANVLYPAPMRDVLMQLALTDVFKAKWSEDIHREWIDALMRNEPDRDRDAIERTREMLRSLRIPTAGYEALIPSLDLPDTDDRHVLAAAIVGRCDVIVTQNLKDFPEEALEPYGIETLHPDDFLGNHLALAPGLSCSALRKVRARLRNPHYTAEDYLAILTQQGLVATAAELEQFKELI